MTLRMRGVGAIALLIVMSLVACTQAGPSIGIRQDQHWLEETGHAPWVTAYKGVHSATHWDSVVEVRCNSLAASIYAANSRLLPAEDDARTLEQPIPTYAKYPVGSVVLKVHRRPGQSPDAPATMWTAMEKVPNVSDAVGGEWRYAEWDADGRLLISGNADVPDVSTRCAYCHVAVQHRDFLYHHASTGLAP